MIQIVLTGNLGQDAKILTKEGKETTTFSCAVSIKKKDTEVVYWFDVYLNYRSPVFEYLKQGKKVAIVGTPIFGLTKPTEEFTKTKLKLQLIADKIELL